MSCRAMPRDDTSRIVAANLRLLRLGRNLQYTKVAKWLNSVGRPLGATSLHRIEHGLRQVTVDDLAAFGLIYQIYPGLLMQPLTIGSYGAVEGVREGLTHNDVLAWTQRVLANSGDQWLPPGDPSPLLRPQTSYNTHRNHADTTNTSL